MPFKDNKGDGPQTSEYNNSNGFEQETWVDERGNLWIFPNWQDSQTDDNLFVEIISWNWETSRRSMHHEGERDGYAIQLRRYTQERAMVDDLVGWGRAKR